MFIYILFSPEGDFDVDAGDGGNTSQTSEKTPWNKMIQKYSFKNIFFIILYIILYIIYLYDVRDHLGPKIKKNKKTVRTKTVHTSSKKSIFLVEICRKDL